MLVKQMMKEPICVGPGETLAVVSRKLKNDNVGCLPVSEGKHVLGMITDRDILTRCIAKSRNPSQMTAREAMSTEIHYCSEEDPVEKAVVIMTNKKVRRLPVLDRDQQLVGIISLTDLMGGTSDPARFEVVFYKKMHDSYGHPHHAELMRVSIAPGHSKEEAIAAAIKQVEQQKQTAWTIFADGYDVTEVHCDDRGRIVEDVERTSEKDEQIRQRAYDLWQREGSPEGRHEAHWMQASREIDVEK
jgi:CBS domain-containing protein